MKMELSAQAELNYFLTCGLSMVHDIEHPLKVKIEGEDFDGDFDLLEEYIKNMIRTEEFKKGFSEYLSSIALELKNEALAEIENNKNKLQYS